MGKEGQEHSLDLEALKDAEIVDPTADLSSDEPKVRTLPPITRAGFELTTRVLWILASCAFMVLVILCFQEFVIYPRYLDAAFESLHKTSATSLASASDVEAIGRAIAAAKEMVDSVSARQKETREYILQVSQLILLNLFLPVLTALLGYVFGTRQADSDKSTDNS